MWRIGVILFCLALAGCDTSSRPAQDAGPDVPDHVDVVDVVDVPDVVDVADVKDGSDADPDGETWPAPSCEVDPHLRLVAVSGYDNLAGYFPYLFIPMYDEQAEITTLYRYHVETGERIELFDLPLQYIISQMVMDDANSRIWFSANGRWNFDHPEDRIPPKMFVWHLDTEILEELTDHVPQWRTPACEAGFASLYLQKLDLDRDRLLLFCTFPDVTRQVGEVYFLDLNTGENIFAGQLEDRYFSKGNLFPESFNDAYFNTYCTNWVGNVDEGGWNGCYWKVDEGIPTLIYESSDGTRINGSTNQVSADHLVYQTWQTENGIELTATDVRSRQTEILPALPVFPQSISPAGKLFPELLTWTEGYELSANGNWLQAGIIGHAFLWNRQNLLYRQVTCEDGNGRYNGVRFLPGDPTGRYGIILSKIGESVLIFIKDLRAAGIMSEDGQLLPPPAK